MTSKSSSRGNNNGRRRGREHRYEEIIQADCEAAQEDLEEEDDDDDHNMSNRQRYMHTNLGNLYSHTSSSSNNNNSSSSTSLSFNKIILTLLIFTSIFGMIYYGLSKEEVRKMHEMEVHEFEEVERLKLKYGLVEKLDDDDGEKDDADNIITKQQQYVEQNTSLTTIDLNNNTTDTQQIHESKDNQHSQQQTTTEEQTEPYTELSSDMDELRSIIQELRIEIKSLKSQSVEIGELRNKTSVLLEELEGEKLKVSALEKAVMSMSLSLPQSLPIVANEGGGGVRRRHN